MAGEVNGELILFKIDELDKKFDAMNKLLGDKYVTKEQHANLEEKVTMQGRVVYGAVALILVAVFGAVIALVLK